MAQGLIELSYWRNFLVGLHQRMGVDIPEADCAALVNLHNVLDYLQTKIKA